MMSSLRPRDDVAGNLTSRRGHVSQLSISDPSHHVTEAIGTLYGDEDDAGWEGSRPLSFISGSAHQEQIYQPPRQHFQNTQPDAEPRRNLTRSVTDHPSTSSIGEPDGMALKKSQTMPVPTRGQRTSTYDSGGSSPTTSSTISLRNVQADSSGSQFPLTNIDNANDIAQELSNLQALRRLSMDVGYNVDPDIPPMSLSTMPAIAPSGDDDENDPSRLLWVPARVHPELAPSEFKNFLQKRVQSIKRRSGDSLLADNGEVASQELGAGGALSRRRSMLSRQIDNAGGRGAVGYVDGAERLERQRSRRSQVNSELSIDELVKDPTRAVQKLAQETQAQTTGSDNVEDDMPILPVAPGGGLRRSTRTTYRKGGSLRSGDKLSLSRRAGHRHQDSETSDIKALPSVPSIDVPKGHTLTRVQSEPFGEQEFQTARSFHRQPHHSQGVLPSTTGDRKYQSADRTSDPSIVPTTEFPQGHPPSNSSLDAPGHQELQTVRSFPERSSSQTLVSQYPDTQFDQSSVDEPSNRTANWGNPIRQEAPSQQYQQQPQEKLTMLSSPSQHQSSINSLNSNSAFLPTGAPSRTDNLAFVPNFSQDEKKVDKKSKKDRDTETTSGHSKTGSAWKWFKAVTDDKEKKKEDSRKQKSKSSIDKTSDAARLDVIQVSIDRSHTKSRESSTFERDSLDSKLQEERKKESNRKPDSKKEKDGNIFSSLFGGGKRKEEKEKSSRKGHHLRVPEPPQEKTLQPDVDYNWTRFPLLEERAIYRMAHIKLANPRRSLLSQVLLSNFMYSYLAIVQAMHPQMNVPVSPQQRRLEEEARRKQQEEDYAAEQQIEDDQDAQNSLDAYDFDYHRATVQYADSSSNGKVDYIDDAQIYEDDHGKDTARDYNYEDSDRYGYNMKDYLQYRLNEDEDNSDNRRDMW